MNAGATDMQDKLESAYFGQYERKPKFFVCKRLPLSYGC
jgi:hypothetical protein